MPTQERNPIAVREVCSSRSQKPNVLPTRRKGSPEENPSNNIVRVLGRRYSLIRCLCALTRPLCTGASRNTTRTKCIHPTDAKDAEEERTTSLQSGPYRAISSAALIVNRYKHLRPLSISHLPVNQTRRLSSFPRTSLSTKVSLIRIWNRYPIPDEFSRRSGCACARATGVRNPLNCSFSRHL